MVHCFFKIKTKLKPNKVLTHNVINKKHKGFTLIELVAVMAIIAVLSAAFVPKISGYMNEAKKVSVLNEAKNVITAYESLVLRSSSLGESSTITNVINNSGGLLQSDDINKIKVDFTVAQCRNLLNTEKYTFNVENGKATEPTLR